MIFLTVGSMFPFDRLVQSVDELLEKQLIQGEVFAQIGDGRYEPKQMAYNRYMAKPEFDQHVADAQILIGHAGVGTIAMALKLRKLLLVVPRRKQFNEHVNDHQVVTARKYQELGCILVAHEMQEIPVRLAQLKSFHPRSREAHPQDIARRIGLFLDTLIPPDVSCSRDMRIDAGRPSDRLGGMQGD